MSDARATITSIVIPSAFRTLAGAKPDNRRRVFELHVRAFMGHVRRGSLDRTAAVDALQAMADESGLVDDIGQDDVQAIMAAADYALDVLPAMAQGVDQARRDKIADLKFLSEILPDGEPKPAPPRLLFSSAEFVKGFVPPDYVIDGIIQRGFLYSLTARTGDGKTALALLLAACVDLGVPFGGHATERGRVLFFAGENPTDARARWIATGVVMGLDTTSRMFTSPMASSRYPRSGNT
jgi:hypothetical protein